MRRAAAVAGRIALPLAAGALVGCSLPPLGSWPLGVAGFGLLAWSLDGRRARGRLAAGFLAGLGQFSIGLAWAVQFSAAGYVALVLLESLLVGLALVLVPPAGPLRPAAVAAALVVAEWARDSFPFGGLPLGSAALGQTGGPFQFAARLGGPLLVLFAAALAGSAVAELALSAAHRRERRHTPAALFLVAAAALAGAGGVLPPGTVVGRLRVAIVQGGGERGLTALQVPPSRVFRAALAETARITGHPQLIVWPEDVVAMGGEHFAHSQAEADLAAIARRYRATVVAGVTEDVGTTRFRNEVVALGPTGRIEAVFEKVHRVPFGEYVPDRGLFSHLANLSAVPRDAIAGHGTGMIATSAGRFAVLVSYEVFFADRGRSGVRAGGEAILVPTNTSSYSNDQAPAQEIAASRLQALEEGRELVQAAPTGYSAVVNPSGAVLRQTSLSVPGLIETTVPLLEGRTPYGDGGDLPVLAGAVVLVALGWLGRRRVVAVDEAEATASN